LGSGLAIQASLPAAPSCAACPADYEKGVTAYNSGHYAAAIQYLLSAQHNPQAPSEVLLYESRAFLQLQQPQKAETAVQEYLAKNPPSADAYYLLGYIYFREKHPKRMRTTWLPLHSITSFSMTTSMLTAGLRWLPT
jgi:tetratricopeptide (TPR) repeat protein